MIVIAGSQACQTSSGRQGAPIAFEITRMSEPFSVAAENFCVFGVT